MRFMKNESDSLRAVDYKDPQCVFVEKPTAFSIGSMNSEGMKSDNPNAEFYETETGRTLNADGGYPASYQGGIAVVERRAESTDHFAVCYSFDAVSSNSMKSSNPNSGCRMVDIARTLDTSTTDPSKNQGGIAVVYDARGNGKADPTIIEMTSTKNTIVEDGVVPTMTARMETGGNQVHAVCVEAQGFPLGFRPENVRVYDETATTVCNGTRPGFTCGVIDERKTYQQTTGTLSPGAHAGSYNGQDAYNDMLVAAVDCRNGTEDPNTNGTLQAKSSGGTSYNPNNVVRESVVRRLTPTECCRLQSFPDGWVDIGKWTDEKGKKHKKADAPKYRALGNSIALPFWFWLLKRISAHCTEKTMGSLFSGIGGFDLCWQFINGDGSCRWESEIEPFCIAVCKKHFGDEETGQKGDWETYVDRNGNEA